MAAEGIFHDAHEVYASNNIDGPWVWVATFANKTLARVWVQMTHMTRTDSTPKYFEVRPV